jgi:hypothetical protein
MKHQLYQPSPPATDSKQRIATLRTFLNRVTSDISLKEYSSWCKYVRSDIDTISNESVKAEAETQFQQILHFGYFTVENNRDKIEGSDRPIITKLIKYLEANDK